MLLKHCILLSWICFHIYLAIEKWEATYVNSCYCLLSRFIFLLFHLISPTLHIARFHLGINVFLFIMSRIWLVNFSKTLTYNNNDSILFRKPQVSQGSWADLSYAWLLLSRIACVGNLLVNVITVSSVWDESSLVHVPRVCYHISMVSVRWEQRKRRSLMTPGTVPLIPCSMSHGQSLEHPGSHGEK